MNSFRMNLKQTFCIVKNYDYEFITPTPTNFKSASKLEENKVPNRQKKRKMPVAQSRRRIPGGLRPHQTVNSPSDVTPIFSVGHYTHWPDDVFPVIYTSCRLKLYFCYPAQFPTR